jgi:hypothetical protein
VWAACPKQWKLKYVDGHREPTNINLLFGTAIHETIQSWLDLLYNHGPKKALIVDLADDFKERLLKIFKEAVITDETTGKKTFPCDEATLREFYLDGVEILDHVKKYRENYFPTRHYELVGCEIGLEIQLTEGVKFVGYIDLVIRHKPTGAIQIIDFKTSTRGWYDREKKDPKKLNQILLYKKFYSEQFNIPEEDITVAFFILKRKINENSEWKQVRITAFEPAHGKNKIKNATAELMRFVNYTFNVYGSVREENLNATPSESSCRFCYFKNKKDLCSEGM